MKTKNKLYKLIKELESKWKDPDALYYGTSFDGKADILKLIKEVRKFVKSQE